MLYEHTKPPRFWTWRGVLALLAASYLTVAAAASVLVPTSAPPLEPDTAYSLGPLLTAVAKPPADAEDAFDDNGTAGTYTYVSEGMPPVEVTYWVASEAGWVKVNSDPDEWWQVDEGDTVKENGLGVYLYGPAPS